MPDYYAHLCFGRRVCNLLNNENQLRIAACREAYEYGLFGPDPLFFYKPLRKCEPRLAAYDAHHRSARPMLEAYRPAIEEGNQYALAYAAGLACHFALDSACHPYIERRGQQGDISHITLEAEFDRMLMERSGIDALHETPQPHPTLCDEFYAAAALGHEGANADVMRRAFAGFYRYSHLFTLVHGTPLRMIVNAVGTIFPGCSNARGLILGKNPAPAAAEINAVLDKALTDSEDCGRKTVEDFMAAALGGYPLGAEFDMDFYGVVHSAEHAAAVLASI